MQAREPVPADLDRLIHERVRLGHRQRSRCQSLPYLQRVEGHVEDYDGNLKCSRAQLEEADYIVCTKSFDGRLPKTEYRLTGGRAKGAGALFESHGSADPRHARGLTREFFCAAAL